MDQKDTDVHDSSSEGEQERLGDLEEAAAAQSMLLLATQLALQSVRRLSLFATRAHSQLQVRDSGIRRPVDSVARVLGGDRQHQDSRHDESMVEDVADNLQGRSVRLIARDDGQTDDGSGDRDEEETEGDERNDSEEVIELSLELLHLRPLDQ